jgi:hypothetical protein
VEKLARNGIVYFEGSAHLMYLRAFKVMYGHLLMQGKTAKCMQENGVMRAISKISINDIYEVYVHVCFVSENQITKLDNGRFNVMLTFEEKRSQYF